MSRCRLLGFLVAASLVAALPAAAADPKPPDAPGKGAGAGGPGAKDSSRPAPPERVGGAGGEVHIATPDQKEAPRVRVNGREIVVERGAEAKTLVLPCAARKHLIHNEIVYVACGPDGVVMVALNGLGAPRLLKHADPGGDVQGFTIVEDQVWAVIVRHEARPVDLAPIKLAPPEKKAAPGDATTVAAAVLSGRAGDVMSQKWGKVSVSLGAADGVKADQRVEFFREQEVILGEGQRAVREETLAVGRVAAVSEKAAQVDLGTDEIVPAGSKARLTNRDLTANRAFPPRVAGVWEASFMARPFLALETIGVGMVSDAGVGYRFKEPVHVQLLLKPFGVGLAGDGNIVAEAANIVTSYDTSYFEIGLGLGWSAVNAPIEMGSAAAEMIDGYSAPRFEKVRDGLSISQMARLGSVDGVNLYVDNFFVLYKNEFQFGGTIAAIQGPISDKSWLLLRGGGGVAGFWFGEIGLRVLVRGNGGPGALFLTPTLGAAGLFGEKEGTCTVYNPETGARTTTSCAEDVSYGGPMVGFGMEWRF